ncbi:MAG: glutamate-cysteine ligase family protein, partial [Pseudomonadota bacterium]
LFANSPFTEGQPNGLLSWRSDIWRDTDNQRSGLHAFVFDGEFGFERYVDWALDVPMYFVLREGRYFDCTSVTFRQFMNGGLEGKIPEATATIGDWNNHLTTLFPDVRLKQFLEMRGADGGPWRRICALPAFWVGLLYDDAALSEAETLAADLNYDAVNRMRNEVPTKGLQAFGGVNRAVQDLAHELVEIAQRGLAARNRISPDGFNETHFLGPLEEVVALGETPAERMLKQYASNWDGDIDHVFDEYAF